ncbi:DgyrCDS13083 [Dimorphilus gyrociliatus]|uniref:DgyrCDS13083 n=1 Tax=Dimorphilus gyrociliatus TaxID=2664684 RepID=A0A7I8W9K9_9ANNE|nr:DgyrCDS13083 [Dimorphilus gyrociliatus]
MFRPIKSKFVYCLSVVVCLTLLLVILKIRKYDVTVNNLMIKFEDKLPNRLTRQIIPQDKSNETALQKSSWDTINEEIAKKYYNDVYLKFCNKIVDSYDISSNVCDCDPEEKEHRCKIDYNAKNEDWSIINKRHAIISHGGEFKPTNCNSIQKVAIVIPYRNRLEHLKILINHFHRILSKQNIHYKIFIVEQAHPFLFNRGAMMDVGYSEAKANFAPDCIIFHDVDMIPEDGRHMYNCLQSPRHMGAYLNKYKYIQIYQTLGGILAMKTTDFERVNGFHTLMYGWGDEDVDMMIRCKKAKYTVVKWPVPLSRYIMIKHERDVGNPLNNFRKSFLSHYSGRHKLSSQVYGISSLKYNVNWVKQNPLFTHISINLTIYINSFYNKKKASCNIKEAGGSYKNNLSDEDCAITCFNEALCYGFLRLGNVCYTFSKFCPPESDQPTVFYYERKKSDFQSLNKFRRIKGSCVHKNFGQASQYTIFVCSDLCLHDKQCQSFTYEAKSAYPCQRKKVKCLKSSMKMVTGAITFVKK